MKMNSKPEMAALNRRWSTERTTFRGPDDGAVNVDSAPWLSLLGAGDRKERKAKCAYCNGGCGYDMWSISWCMCEKGLGWVELTRILTLLPRIYGNDAGEQRCWC